MRQDEGRLRAGGIPWSFRTFATVLLRDAMVEVPQRPLDATVAPPRVLRRHPHDEQRDLFHDPGPPLPASLKRPIPGDQSPVPAQDRVGRHDRRHPPQEPATKSPALRGEDLYETARRMAPHTAITTNADYIRLPRFRYRPEVVNYERVQPDLVRAVPFGDGFIDYRAFFLGLRDGGFDGVATYEMCSPLRGGGTLHRPQSGASEAVCVIPRPLSPTW